MNMFWHYLKNKTGAEAETEAGIRKIVVRFTREERVKCKNNEKLLWKVYSYRVSRVWIYIALKVKNRSQIKQKKRGRNSATKRKVHLPLVVIIVLKRWTPNVNSSEQILSIFRNIFEIELWFVREKQLHYLSRNIG